MADEFVELHGDRLFGDDAAIVAGLARIGGRRVACRPAEGRRHRREHPAQLRHAPPGGLSQGDAGHGARRARSACRSSRSSTFPGAHPGPESEERGIAEAIARSIGLMSRLRTPIVTVITGEGGSGGALAIAVGDVVIALENAVYSVISPEGLRIDPVADVRRGRDRRRRDAHVGRRPARPRCHRHRRARARRGRARRARSDGRPAPRGHPRSASTRSPSCRSTTLLEQRYRRYRALGAYTEVARPEVPGRVDRSLADRLRDLLDPARRGLIGVEGWSRDDDPPAREEV